VALCCATHRAVQRPLSPLHELCPSTRLLALFRAVPPASPAPLSPCICFVLSPFGAVLCCATCHTQRSAPFPLHALCPLAFWRCPVLCLLPHTAQRPVPPACALSPRLLALSCAVLCCASYRTQRSAPFPLHALCPLAFWRCPVLCCASYRTHCSAPFPLHALCPPPCIGCENPPCMRSASPRTSTAHHCLFLSLTTPSLRLECLTIMLYRCNSATMGAPARGQVARAPGARPSNSGGVCSAAAFGQPALCDPHCCESMLDHLCGVES
jgi:hypothetical protein